MKRHSKLIACIAAAVTALLLTILVWGGNISASDPVISLSYLNETFKTQILNQIGSTLTAEAQKLENRFNERINSIKNAGQKAAPAATHTVTAIRSGSVYTVPSGSEFLFLSGTASVQSAGVSDVTEGGQVAIGGALTVNHLYVSSAQVKLQASAESKILIRK